MLNGNNNNNNNNNSICIKSEDTEASNFDYAAL